jgi:hypothetical protein
MADQRPYVDLSINLLARNYGPADKMQGAVAAYAPFRRRALVDRRSSIGMATGRPLLPHKLLPLGRFGSKRIGKSTKGTRKVGNEWRPCAPHCSKKQRSMRTTRFFGRGKLAAKDMLDAAPAPANKLAEQALHSARFPFFTRERAMLELEALHGPLSFQESFRL